MSAVSPSPKSRPGIRLEVMDTTAPLRSAISPGTFEGDHTLAVEDLSDAEIEAIRRAEPPTEAARFDHELTTEPITDS